MSMSFDKDNGDLLCTFPRRLDTEACTRLEPEIFRALENFNSSVVFDLSQVDYVSSSFLRICLRVFRRFGADKFSIVNVSPLVKKVFKIAGFDESMKIT